MYVKSIYLRPSTLSVTCAHGRFCLYSVAITSWTCFPPTRRPHRLAQNCGYYHEVLGATMDSSSTIDRAAGQRLYTLPFLLPCFLLLIASAGAQPVSLPFSFCAPSTFHEPNPLKRVNVTAVYGQLYHPDDPTTRALKLTAIGEIGDTLEGYLNSTGFLATLFTSTDYLTYSISDKTSSFCEVLRPPSPLPTLPTNDTFYCPLSAGPLAFGLAVPLPLESYALKTLVTQLRIVDSSSPAHELACVEIAATPAPREHRIYGGWTGIFWGTLGLTLAFWLVTSIGRVSAAWDRGLGRTGHPWWLKLERTGFVLASALSGEKFSVSPALLRFATPSARDLVLTTQWCATLGMIAVQWPDFICTSRHLTLGFFTYSSRRSHVCSNGLVDTAVQ